MAKRIITEADINQAVDSGKKVLECDLANSIVTAQASDKAEEYGVAIVGLGQAPNSDAAVATSAGTANQALTSESDALISEVCRIMKDSLPANISEAVLNNLVRKVVAEKLSAAPASTSPENMEICPSGVCHIKGQRLQKDTDSPILVDEQVFLADALGQCADAELAGGYMEWEKASFTRTVDCAEVTVVVAGELQLIIADKTVDAKAGDMLYLPEGVEVTYKTATSVRLACINNVA